MTKGGLGSYAAKKQPDGILGVWSPAVGEWTGRLTRPRLRPEDPEWPNPPGLEVIQAGRSTAGSGRWSRKVTHCLKHIFTQNVTH